MKSLRIATRESPLALWQAEFVRDQLQRHHESLDIELIGMTTQGDQWLSSPLSEVGGKGLFIKELEQAMLLGRADIAVHSVKDLPAEMPEGFILPVIGFRADQHDVLVSAKGDLMNCPKGLVLVPQVCDDKRNCFIIGLIFKMSSIRGNVGTRLAKLDQGEFDAIVLAAAGLQRLGLARKTFIQLLRTFVCRLLVKARWELNVLLPVRCWSCCNRWSMWRLTGVCERSEVSAQVLARTVPCRLRQWPVQQSQTSYYAVRWYPMTRVQTF